MTPRNARFVKVEVEKEVANDFIRQTIAAGFCGRRVKTRRGRFGNAFRGGGFGWGVMNSNQPRQRQFRISYIHRYWSAHHPGYPPARRQRFTRSYFEFVGKRPLL